MKLTLFFEHRFVQDPDGVIYSTKNYDYQFFVSRYLQIFDEVTIVARVKNITEVSENIRPTEGKGVRIHSLGNWQGALEFLTSHKNIRQKLNGYRWPQTAVLMIVPSTISGLVYSHLRQTKHPYGLEVVGNPYDAFSPQAAKGFLRPVWRYWFTKQLQTQCAHATAVSYVTTHALQQRYPASKTAFSIACSDVWLPDEAFVDAPIVIDPSPRTFKLINIGTMEQLYKGQDVLMKAVALCIAQGIEMNLTLLGDGRYRNYLENLAQELNLQGRVYFCGQIPAGSAVRYELDQADLFVMPSLTEGLPRAMLEAMARGIPCIGSDVGGIPELLPAEDTVIPNDVDALAQKIKEVLQSPQRRAQMSQYGLAVAHQYHSQALQAQREKMHTYLKNETMSWIQQHNK